MTEFETAKIAKVTGKCPACEDYAEKNSTTPPKIAVMACEGACARGEVARRAANMVAHRLATDSTVRICLGGAFTKDTGQRNLVRRADKVIAIEGCFINCSSRMMQGILPDLKPEIVRADLIYNLDLPFGIDEVPDEMFTVYAHQVAEQVVRDYLNGSPAPVSCRPSTCGAGPTTGGCGCSSSPLSCGTGPAGAENDDGVPQYLPPDVVNVRWEGTKKFRVENARGGILLLEEGSDQCSPCDAFMAALGGCANLAILGQLQKNRITPGALAVKVSGVRKSGHPSAYEKIHVTFSIACDAEEAALDMMIEQAMAVLCPVAVTLGRAAEVTWEYRRVKAE
jgi:uncharacterized OsmC-like protein/uncharacterized metal-binding protein